MAGRKYSNQGDKKKSFDWGRAARVVGHTVTTPFVTARDAVTDGPGKAMQKDAKRKIKASRPSKGYQD